MSTDFSRMAIFKDLVENADFFWKKLGNFLGYGDDQPLKAPIVMGYPFDLHRLFIEVTFRGGIEKVIKERKCKEVMGVFNFEQTITNAAYLVKRYYLDMLFEFEHVYYFQEPLTSFHLKEQAMNLLVDKSKQDPKIYGVIDGKFESGYLVTMQKGSEELKGVIYHVPNDASTSRKRKNSSKPPEVETPQPMPLKSGYIFFAGEQYPKLKAQFGTKERSLIMEIGKMWDNLSEADKQVYQEKGAVTEEPDAPVIAAIPLSVVFATNEEINAPAEGDEAETDAAVATAV